MPNRNPLKGEGNRNPRKGEGNIDKCSNCGGRIRYGVPPSMEGKENTVWVAGHRFVEPYFMWYHTGDHGTNERQVFYRYAIEIQCPTEDGYTQAKPTKWCGEIQPGGWNEGLPCNNPVQEYGLCGIHLKPFLKEKRQREEREAANALREAQRAMAEEINEVAKAVFPSTDWRYSDQFTISGLDFLRAKVHMSDEKANQLGHRIMRQRIYMELSELINLYEHLPDEIKKRVDAEIDGTRINIDSEELMRLVEAMSDED